MIEELSQDDDDDDDDDDNNDVWVQTIQILTLFQHNDQTIFAGSRTETA